MDLLGYICYIAAPHGCIAEIMESRLHDHFISELKSQTRRVSTTHHNSIDQVSNLLNSIDIADWFRLA